jgi:hypothetical protein
MVEIAVIGVIVGAVLAVRFSVYALIVAIPLLLAVAALAAVSNEETGWWIAVAMALAAASVQVGYFGESVLRLTADNWGRDRPPTRRSAHFRGD